MMPVDEDIIKKLHADAAQLLLRHKSDEEIVDHLVANGCDRNYAEMILLNVKNDAADKVHFRKSIAVGVGFLLAGFLLTYSSYFFAISRGAPFYFLYWGLLVAGVSMIARAFILFRK